MGFKCVSLACFIYILFCKSHKVQDEDSSSRCAAVTQPSLALSHAHQQLSPVPIAELVTESRTLFEL